MDVRMTPQLGLLHVRMGCAQRPSHGRLNPLLITTLMGLVHIHRLINHVQLTASPGRLLHALMMLMGTATARQRQGYAQHIRDGRRLPLRLRMILQLETVHTK